MILSGGENVFPQEVEELLAGHDAVADAAVFGVPDPDFGQRLAAFVVLKPGASATEEELQAYVRDRLARTRSPGRSRSSSSSRDLDRQASASQTRGTVRSRKGGSLMPDPEIWRELRAGSELAELSRRGVSLAQPSSDPGSR